LKRAGSFCAAAVAVAWRPANLGTVGLNFQVAGFGPFHAPGASDMILRNANTGQFEVYDQQSDHNGQQLGRGRLEFPSWRLRPSILLPITPVTLVSSCKRWRVLAAAAAQLTD